MTKVLVIGIDGATWNLMKSMAEEGKLPTLKKLMNSGVYGDLESIIPPTTTSAWISFATGKNPGKHGCYDFDMPEDSLSNVRIITSKNIYGTTFYELLSKNDKKCIIINLPGSYPPRINGIVITSLMTQGDNCVFPPNLVDEIPEFRHYRIIPNVSLHEKGKIMEYVRDIRKLERHRFECAKKLFKRDWDFFFVLFSGVDWVQHDMFDKLILGQLEEYSDPVMLYREIDEYISWFVSNAPQGTYLIIISDHGFKSYNKIFYINSWLQKEDFLKVEQKPQKETSSGKFSVESKKVKLKRINLKFPLFLLKYFTWLIPYYMKLKRVLPIELKIDVRPKLSETIAYSAASTVRSNFGSIYINDKKRFADGKVKPELYEKVRKEIMERLKHLKDPKTGEHIVKKVWRKEELYFGDKLDVAPDIIFMLSEEYQVRSGLGISQPFGNEIVRNSNGHALYGIFLAYSSDIKRGLKIENTKIYDLAPTLLYIMDVPIPKDLDGRVLKEIFREDSELSTRRIRYQNIEEREKTKIKLKIKGLRTLKKI